MELEGTANEKALIVLFAYIIGFISAFIAFNYAFPPTTSTQVSFVYLTNEDAQAAVAGATDAVDSSTAPADSTTSDFTERAASPDRANEIAYENQGLYYFDADGYPILLSKAIGATNFTYDSLQTLAERQGFHSELAASGLAAAAGLVYFCEVYDVASECVPYVYSIDDQVLHVLQDLDGPVTIPADSARDVSVSSNGTIRVGSLTSIDPEATWLLR